jgi:hypothetical protein
MMKLRAIATVLLGMLAGLPGTAQDVAARVRQLETTGGAREARALLEQQIRAHPRDPAVLEAHARFLDSRREPEARAAYRRLLNALPATDSARRRAAAHRLAQLDLIEGDRASAETHLAEYRAAGGSGLTLASNPAPLAALPSGTIWIPGPLRSFSRMAALSPDLPASELMLALARNIVTSGYQAVSGSEGLEQTEYLKLVIRYLSQARELEKLAGDSKVLKIEACDSTQTADLIKILGFRMRGGCGAEVVLETVNATRAFLTIDSGFPLAELEEALRANRPFVYDYAPTAVPVLYSGEYWLSAKEKQSGEFIDVMLGDPSMCRLYLGLAKLDPETAEAVRRGLPVQRIRAFAHVFDFFGGMFRIRNGRVNVPGGSGSEAAWTEMVGARPDQGVAFLERLVTRDDGWLASYFDSLMRISGPTLDYLAEPVRLKRFYAALRGRVTSPGPARPVFRANTDLMLLTTRLRVTGGQPQIPGGVELWRNLFVKHPHGKYDGKLTKSAAGWKEPDDLLEALFGLSRKAVENEPLKIFLALSDLERRRSKPLEFATVDRLARSWRAYGAQYSLFSECPALSDATILSYLDKAGVISEMGEPRARADAAGVMQALAGLWQVFCRHRLIPPGKADPALAAIVAPFERPIKDAELFDAARAGVDILLKATGAPASVNPHERMLELLAGTAATHDADSQAALVAEMNRIFEAQRLVSLKVLFDLADHLGSLAKGEKLNTPLLNRLASRVSEVSLPKATLTAPERSIYAFGYWTERHIDSQRKLNLRAVVEKNSKQPERLSEIRGLLAPLIRDSLVGLLYVHYAPPGSQLLYTNPLFARSHDFVGIAGNQQTWKSTEVLGSGWPSSAGGRLMGSLIGLPYALAEAEQNFLIPTREQALIWGDLVPQMLVSSKLPRWWHVSPAQLRWVGLQMRLGESLVAEAALSEAVLGKVVGALELQIPPARLSLIADLLGHGDAAGALEQITPAELYQLGVQSAGRGISGGSFLAEEIRLLAARHPAECNPAAVSEAFGTPKPTLATTHRPELLNLRTFPTLMGYSSRVLAESWESNNLLFAALADELTLPPTQLNVLIPEWTQKAVERIFATHLEDWPALLRSIRVVAEDIRKQIRGIQAAENRAALN